MYNFVLKRIPLSYNNSGEPLRTPYKNALKASLAKYNPSYSLLTDDLYAIIYYFYKVDLKKDTDNLSKPAWDCLNGILFNDDSQIKIRIAGSFNLTKKPPTIDMAKFQKNLLDDLLDAFDNEDHIIYVECGKFEPAMFKFNIE